jgi:hypothetical protein
VKLHEWRSSAALVQYAGQLLKSDGFRDLLAMLEEEHPHRAIVTNVTSEKHLGMIHGYNLLLQYLRLAGTSPGPEHEEPETTWNAKLKQ